MENEKKITLALFVASSDNTRDVFKAVGQSHAIYWPNCTLKKYVGVNSSNCEPIMLGFTTVLAPVHGWCQELHTQLTQLKEEYVLLLLDDFFLLGLVNDDCIKHLVSLMDKRDIDYLRLIPISGSWVYIIFTRFFSKLRGEEVISIKAELPYFSSLQAAVWRRKHLLNMLEICQQNTIWDFEHLSLPGRQHFAVAHSSAIQYKHVVEKGKWLPYAKSLLLRHSISSICSTRKVWPKTYFLRYIFGKIIFGLIGYSWIKIKRMVRA